jgi:hypothetical protein
VAIIMLGSHTFRVLTVILLIIAVVLQTGATSVTKAIKFSAKLITGHGPAVGEPAAEVAAVEATAAEGLDRLNGSHDRGSASKNGYE